MMRPSVRALVLVFGCVFLFPPSRASLRSQERDLPAPEAWAALESGDAAKAAHVFREALERNPYSPLLHVGAGSAAFALGRYDSAISSLKRALELNSRLPNAAVLLAQAAYARGDLHLAIRSMETAAGLVPGDRRIATQLERWRTESTLHAGLTERPGVRFRILFEGATQQTIGDRVGQVLESAYWTVGKTLNSYPSETVTVVLYTNRQFRDITRAPAWSGGRFDGRIHLPVGGALRAPHALDSVVRHEFVHAVIAYTAPRNVPTWVNEGLASVLDSSDRGWVQRALGRTRERVPLDDLDGGFGDLDGASARVAYAESAVAAELLCERVGSNLGIFLQMLGSGHTVDQALSTLNVRPELFRAEWRRRVGLE
jgi:tetratricopeptide (TPR) repeat protein